MGRVEHGEEIKAKLKGNAQPEVTYSTSDLTSSVVSTNSSTDTRSKGVDKNFYSIKLKRLLSNHSQITKKRAITLHTKKQHSVKHHLDYRIVDLEYSRKLRELAKISKPSQPKRTMQDIYGILVHKLPNVMCKTPKNDHDYHMTDINTTVHTLWDEKKDLDEEQKLADHDFSRRLVGLTAKKKSFDPHEHSHCCHCVQSFECFWPRSNLQTVRMQDFDRSYPRDDR